MTDALSSLIEAAGSFAARGANRYLFVKNIDADSLKVAEAIKERLKVKMPEAIEDAKAAIDCGMGQAAAATFQASMVLAGIEAAEIAAGIRAE